MKIFPQTMSESKRKKDGLFVLLFSSVAKNGSYNVMKLRVSSNGKSWLQ